MDLQVVEGGRGGHGGHVLPPPEVFLAANDHLEGYLRLIQLTKNENLRGGRPPRPPCPPPDKKRETWLDYTSRVKKTKWHNRRAG